MGVPLTQPSWLPSLFRLRIPFHSFPALSSQLPVTLIRKSPQLLQSDFTREDQGWTHLSLLSIRSVPFLGPLPSSSSGQVLYSTPGSWRPSWTQPRVLSTPRPLAWPMAGVGEVLADRTHSTENPCSLVLSLDGCVMAPKSFLHFWWEILGKRKSPSLSDLVAR